MVCLSGVAIPSCSRWRTHLCMHYSNRIVKNKFIYLHCGHRHLGFFEQEATIFGQEGGAGESILINCELLDSQDQMHVLLYFTLN